MKFHPHIHVYHYQPHLLSVKVHKHWQAQTDTCPTHVQTGTHTLPPLQDDKCVRRQGEIINYQANGHQAEFCFIKL